MEARLVESLPEGEGWQYEPKWDGFRCLAFRAGAEVDLRAKSGKPLARYFPEVATLLRDLPIDRFVLDGELTVPAGDTLSFDALQARLHPAESRVRKLAAETPAIFILFDALAVKGTSLMATPLAERRAALEALYAEAGERAMLKVKLLRTADCVVGGFRYATDNDLVGSLLLGLHDEAGLLHHVGFTSTIKDEERKALTRKLEKLIAPPGFTGDAPGAPSRWSTDRSAEWQPLKPRLVVEVKYDQVTGNRFRHGTRLLRWRRDKKPAHCNCDQLQREAPPAKLVIEVIGR